VGYAYNYIHDHQLDGMACAATLLKKDESNVPFRVKESLSFVDRLGLWYIISRNSPATSCRDAAQRRHRLGTEGIPLSDELRSVCMVFYDQDEHRQYVMLNCRANFYFDLKKVHKIIKAHPKRPIAKLSPDELKRVFLSEYGTVSPFVNMNAVRYQLFDHRVLKTFHPPYTMMTNAGDHTWGIEIYPDQLVEALKKEYPDQVLVNDLCVDHLNDEIQTKPVFGIITGNGPESGIALWNHLTQSIRDQLKDQFSGDLGFPNVIVNSVPEMGLSMELAAREEIVWAFIQQAAQKLCNSGVTHIALACHTTHYFTERIRSVCDKYNVTFVSMAETVIDYIQRNNVKDMTIIGIPYVSDLGKWSAYKKLASLNIQPMNECVRPTLLEIGYLIKKSGSDPKGLNVLNHILKAGVPTDNVLIALTEISVLLSGFPKKQRRIGRWNIIDPLELYGQELAKIYINYIHELSDLSIGYEDTIPIDQQQ